MSLPSDGLLSMSRSLPPHYWQAALGRILSAPLPRSGFHNSDWAYHQQVVDHLTTALRGVGVVVISEVDLLSVTGQTARADFMGLRPGFGPVCTEVKTSLVYDDYEQFTGDAFRRSQAAVLSFIPMGGHVKSPNLKIADIGLTPNVWFPPMRLDIIYALPGQEFRFRTLPPGTPVPPGAL